MLSVLGYSQQYIFGKVSGGSGSELPNVVIINMRTDEKILTDKDGNFIIAAKIGDELRFLKNSYDRNSFKIATENYSKPLNVTLEKSPFLIEEIELAFTPTGNLKKDSKALDAPRKLVALQSSLNAYMRSPMQEVVAQATTVPSAFKSRDLREGTISLLSIGSGGGEGLLSAVAGLIAPSKKTQLTTANYSETQEFYYRIKSTIDLSFYTEQGWDEEEIDRFLIYADQSYELAKKFRKSFDVAQISLSMRLAYKEYVKTRKVKS